MQGRDFLLLKDFSKTDLEKILNFATELKKKQKANESHRLLEDKSIGLYFEKTSTRTRISFEVGVYQLGAQPLFLSAGTTQLGAGLENLKDSALVMSRYLDLFMARVFKHEALEEFVKYATIPVINGLSDLSHPCQIMADFLTIQEQKEQLEGLKLAYVGDGNNVCNSLLLGCPIVGVDITVGTPKEYKPPEKVVSWAKELAEKSGTSINLIMSAQEAVKDADVVYTDTWISMGQEEEAKFRKKVFPPFQVNKKLLSHAKKDAIFLHCLPAHWGYEVTEEVLHGPQSAVFDEAENRLHAQKAIMVALLKGI
ncbi:MAG: ornithine carbamoyltransferase [Candidatus Hermodarchaeota archaeon]